MPAPPSPFLAPSSILPPPKLRSSCDGCGVSKVKCDRERPKCARCAAAGLTCIYGTSRKFGKPARKRPASDMNTGIEKRICTPRATTSTFSKLTSESFNEQQILNRAVQHDFSGGNIIPFQAGIETSLGSDELNQPSLNFYSSFPSEEWPQIGDLDQLGDWQQTGEWLESKEDGADPFSNFPSEATIVSKTPENSHSCARDSYEIFRDLICPSASLHAPESNSITVSAQLDQVLQFNRHAIERLSQVLKCPCAKSGHRAMVHASIVSRILIWYQQAAGWTGSSSWGPRPPTLINSSKASSVSSSSSPALSPRVESDIDTRSSPSLVQATGFAVEHVPVTMGAFNIEDQNVQGAFRNQLVLSELKKTAHLIEIFISITPDPGESSAVGLIGLYSHLGNWLQGEYTRTVGILKSRLKILNENLES